MADDYSQYEVTPTLPTSSPTIISPTPLQFQQTPRKSYLDSLNGNIGAFAENVGRGASGGLTDYVNAAINNGGFSNKFQQALAQVRARNANIQQNYPMAAAAGNITGAITSTAGGGVLSQVAKNATQGAMSNYTANPNTTIGSALSAGAIQGSVAGGLSGVGHYLSVSPTGVAATTIDNAIVPQRVVKQPFADTGDLVGTGEAYVKGQVPQMGDLRALLRANPVSGSTTTFRATAGAALPEVKALPGVMSSLGTATTTAIKDIGVPTAVGAGVGFGIGGTYGGLTPGKSFWDEALLGAEHGAELGAAVGGTSNSTNLKTAFNSLGQAITTGAANTIAKSPKLISNGINTIAPTAGSIMNQGVANQDDYSQYNIN